MKLRLAAVCAVMFILPACTKQAEPVTPSDTTFLRSYPARECLVLARAFSRERDALVALLDAQENAKNSASGASRSKRESDIAASKDKMTTIGSKLIQTGC